MIQAVLNGGIIVVTASDSESALLASHFPGAIRTAKMPPRTWRMPLNMGTIATLRGAGVLADPTLTAEARRMCEVQRFVEAQKQADKVEPIADVPLKPGMQLYNHQVKAFNIALALMGYDINNSAEGIAYG